MSKKTEHLSHSKERSKLPQIISSLNPNAHLLYLSVLRQLCNKRAGTASTKTRAEVRGGGAKPWRQKGTGRARAGSIRSPLWVGGGIAFGPKPRDFKFSMPKKARNLAIAQAIALKSEDLQIIEKLPEIKDSKTKSMVSYLKSLNLNKKPFLFIAVKDEPFYLEAQRAIRNIPYVAIKEDRFVGAYDLLRASSVIMTEAAIKSLEKRFSNLLRTKENKVV